MKITPKSGSGPRLYRGLYPSVTEVLKVVEKSYLDNWRRKVGAQEADILLRNASAFGTRVHTTAQQVALGEETEPDMELYALAVRSFLLEHVDEVLATEIELVSTKFKFGGTPDLYCRLKDGSLAVVDYKTTSQLSREHGLQTAAYALLCREHEMKVNRRLVVRIKKDKPGTYYCRKYHNHGEDVQAFLSLLNFWWWRNGSSMEKRRKKSA